MLRHFLGMNLRNTLEFGFVQSFAFPLQCPDLPRTSSNLPQTRSEIKATWQLGHYKIVYNNVTFYGPGEPRANKDGLTTGERNHQLFVDTQLCSYANVINTFICWILKAVMVHFHCQLDLESPRRLDVESTREGLQRSKWGGETQPECGMHHPMGVGLQVE